MAERWRPIAHHPLYDVSDRGRVRSWNSHGNRAKRPKVLKLPPGNHGYPVVKLYDGGGKDTARDWLVHRLVLDTFVGECPEGMECCHNNGIRTDNRLDNLRWGTYAENQHDKNKHGTHNKGERHGRSRLTEAKVVLIRSLYETGMFPQMKLATMFDIGQDHVSDIVNYKLWNHV